MDRASHGLEISVGVPEILIMKIDGVHTSEPPTMSATRIGIMMAMFYSDVSQGLTGQPPDWTNIPNITTPPPATDKGAKPLLSKLKNHPFTSILFEVGTECSPTATKSPE
jgi:hypothetical protein